MENGFGMLYEKKEDATYFRGEEIYPGLKIIFDILLDYHRELSVAKNHTDKYYEFREVAVKTNAVREMIRRIADSLPQKDREYYKASLKDKMENLYEGMFFNPDIFSIEAIKEELARVKQENRELRYELEHGRRDD